MKPICLALVIMILSLSIESISTKHLSSSDIQLLHAKYNAVKTDRERRLLKDSFSAKYGSVIADRVSQLPSSPRKLWGYDPIKELRKLRKAAEKEARRQDDLRRKREKAAREHLAKVAREEVERQNREHQKNLDAINNAVKSAFDNANDANTFVAQTISATAEDVAKELQKATEVISERVVQIKKEAEKVSQAVKDGINQVVTTTMDKIATSQEVLKKTVDDALPAIQNASDKYIKELQENAKEAKGLIVEVGKKVFKVTQLALEGAKKFIEEKLLPWLQSNMGALWQNSKKNAFETLGLEIGVESTGLFESKFDKSKFTDEQITEGMRKVTVATLKSGTKEFGEQCEDELPWLRELTGKAAMANAPLCVGAIALTVASMGIAGATIGQCAMAIIQTMTPSI